MVHVHPKAIVRVVYAFPVFYKWPPAVVNMLRILGEIAKTSGLVAIFYVFSISLTFYNKWTLSVSGVQSVQCPITVLDV